MENNEGLNDYRAEEAVESSTPGNDAPMTTEAMAGLEEVKADPMADDATRQHAHERAMFERYVKDNGQQIPENFKSAGDWFDSLKGAQAKYTQSQQEVADLKRQYEMSGTTDNPDYVAPETASIPDPAPVVDPVVPTESTEDMLDELAIPAKEEAPAEPEAEAAPVVERVTDEDYRRWTVEVNSTGGISEETRDEIRRKAGFTDAMINDFLSAQQAKRKAAFVKAADIVGGGQKLSKILRWASTNYTGERLAELTRGLANDAVSDITLRGLAAEYDSANPEIAEPQIKKAGTVTPATAQSQISQLPPYKSMMEYRMDMSNPRFKRDDKFRNAVEQRASVTDWRTVK